MKAAFVVGVASANEFHEISERVNSMQTTWKAEAPAKFDSIEEAKPFLGAFLPGDAQYEEPEVVEIPAINAAVPTSFDSAENWPQCTVISNVRDQSKCGSCWAFASTASFESRACIESGKDIKYSPEDTAFCSSAGYGCQGGNSAWGYFENTGVVTGGDYFDIGSGSTCYPYSLAPCAHHVPATDKYPECPSSEYPSPRCARSCSESGYSKSWSSDKLRASSSYSVRGESQIMQELATNGPMYAAFSVYSDFLTYKSGVYKQTSGSYVGGHAVTLVGYGELNGDKYWKIKNSWNEEWGDHGHFLIVRGVNECGIEDSVSAGQIVAPLPPSPSPTPPVPSPVPPTPSPSPTPAQCFDITDKATCEGTTDEKTGEQCKWCADPSAFLPCVTAEWGCNGVVV